VTPAPIGKTGPAAGAPASGDGVPAGPSGPPEVEARELGWTYAGRSRPAIEGLTFRLEPGRVMLVLGPSGSGKSTLARAMAGLIPHVLPGTWQGSLRIGRLDVAETPARLLGERVGLVFQDPDSQLVMARVADEVAFGLENRGRPRAEMQAEVPLALAQVGLEGFESRATMTLSGGEKQRLAIADVLAPRPGLMVLDEPTANLDPPGMHSTFERLAELAGRRTHTIVLIEHRLEAALPLADDVLLIDDNGRQLAFGPAAGVDREAVAMLERSGAWLPRAWQGAALGGSHIPGRSSGTPAGSTLSGAVQGDARAVLVEAAAVRVEYAADESGSHVALDGVSVSIRAGERIALVGPNGAGKSSLLFAVAGLLRPASGSVGIRILPLAGSPNEPLRNPVRLSAREIATRIGMVFQDPELGFVARTARGEVAAGAAALGTTGRPGIGGAEGASAGASGGADAADGVLAHFGLGHLAGHDPFRLSQGEQRRLSLAALALLPPAILLLDEPTFGLDRRGTESVLTLLDSTRSHGQAQVLATHDPRLLPACDRVVALDRGRIVFDGTPDAFLADPPYEPAGPWRDAAAAEQARAASEPAAAASVSASEGSPR
jgi:energy-coupling factor transport system ATP-binding protein